VCKHARYHRGALALVPRFSSVISWRFSLHIGNGILACHPTVMTLLDQVPQAHDPDAIRLLHKGRSYSRVNRGNCCEIESPWPYEMLSTRRGPFRAPLRVQRSRKATSWQSSYQIRFLKHASISAGDTRHQETDNERVYIQSPRLQTPECGWNRWPFASGFFSVMRGSGFVFEEHASSQNSQL